ncbi:hypothetical protein [Nakamurella lactea]|uniref:hypothetical protein n=1 Tax=Nakamurella lactea TaxID=459515 RepID=UPI0004101650|nr:hypothetical protein [Nakamurella lactea]
MRRSSIILLTTAALGAILLTGCGNAPGSVAGDPLAVKLVDAEKKMQGWGGVEMSMTFSGHGALSGRTLPCIAMTSSTEPAETFTMDYVTSPDSSSGCSGSPDETVTIDYADGTLYVTDPTDYSADGPKGCDVRITSHAVSADLAEEFMGEQTSQTKMADLMKAATKISGDEHTITVAVDTAAMMKLGNTSIPAGADPDDIDVTAVAQLDDDGAMASLTMTIQAGDEGSLDIDTHYAKASAKPELPDSKCVTAGSPATSADDIKGYLT